MKSLLIAPVFDDVTVYSKGFADTIKPLLENVTYIGGSTVSRSQVEAVLPSVDLIVFYDHGTETALWGSPSEAVIDTSSAPLLEGKMLYTLACLFASEGGVVLWRAGLKMFWGYTEPASFTSDSLDDFEEFFNSGLQRYLEGCSWTEALLITRDLGGTLIAEMSISGRFIAASAMQGNVDCLRCYDGGDDPDAEYPESTCPFRRVALRLFGRDGWFLRDMIKRSLKRIVE